MLPRRSQDIFRVRSRDKGGAVLLDGAESEEELERKQHGTETMLLILSL